MNKVKNPLYILLLTAIIFGCMTNEEELPSIEFKGSALTVTEGLDFSVTLKSNKGINSHDTVYIIYTGGDARDDLRLYNVAIPATLVTELFQEQPIQ